MRRVLLRVIRVVAVLLLILGGIYLFRDRLLAGPLARIVAWQLSEATGGSFTLRRVEGDWFSELVLVDLRGSLDGMEVRCDRLEASYGLRDLLGERPQDGVRAVGVRGLRLSLDLTRPSEPSEPFDYALLPSPLPQVTIDGSVRLLLESGTVDAPRVAVEGSGEMLTFRLEAVRAPEGLELPRVSGTFSRSGRIECDAEVAGGRLAATVDGPRIEASFAELDLARLREDLAGMVSGRVVLDEKGAIEGEAVLSNVRHASVALDHLELRARHAEGVTFVEHLQARSGEAVVEASGVVVAPEAPTFVSAVQRIRATVPDLRAFLPEFPVEASVEVDAVSEDGRTILVREMRAEGAGTSLLLDGSFTPEIGDPDASTFDLTARGTIGDVSRLSADLPRIEGEIALRAALRGTLRAPRAECELLGQGLRIEGERVDHLAIEAEVTPDSVRGSLELRAAAGRMVVTGALDPTSGDVAEGSFDIDLADFKAFLAMVPGAPALEGRLSGKGTFTRGAGGLRGQGDLSGSGLRMGEGEIGTVHLTASAAEGRLLITRLDATGGWGEASLAGELRTQERTAHIARLRGRYEEREGELLAPLDIAWTEEEVRTLSALHARVAGIEVKGSAAYGSRIEADLELRGVDLALAHPDLAGRAEARLRYTDGDFEVSARSESLTFRGRTAKVALRLVQASDGLSLSELDLRDEGGLAVTGSARLPLRFTPKEGLVSLPAGERTLALTARVADPALYLPAKGRDFVLELTGDDSGLRGRARILDLLPAEGLLLRGESLLTLVCDAAGTRATFSSEEGHDLVAGGEIRLDRGITWSDPASWESALEEAHLEGAILVNVPRIEAFAALLPPGMRLAGAGEVRLDLSGALAAPAFEGSAVLSGLDWSSAGATPPLREGSARLRLTAGRIEILALEGELGYAPFSLTGTVDLPGEAPLTVDLQAKGENLLLARDRHLRLRADIDLHVHGPVGALLAEGSVKITDALYSRPMDLLARSTPAADASLQLFSLGSEGLGKMRFDIAVTGTESFHVRNNIVRGAFSLDLRLRGTGEVPLPSGSIQFRDTLVKLPFSSLKVDQGELSFPPESPFDPFLRVAAHTRMKGYDLDVQTKGPVSDLEVLISANPSLAPDDAILLLTTGATREELERTGIAKSALTRIGTFFGKRLISRLGGPEDPDAENLLDRFTFEIGRDVSRSGSETIQGEFELTERWFLRGERDRFDDYNFGVVWRIRFR